MLTYIVCCTLYQPHQNTYALGAAKQWGVNKSVVVVQPPAPAKFTRAQCQHFVVEDEISAEKGTVVQTRARQTLRQTNATEWAFDFSEQLLLPWIDTVMYSLAVPPGAKLVQHAAEEPQEAQGARVVVRTAEPTTATVTVEVAQCV